MLSCILLFIFIENVKRYGEMWLKQYCEQWNVSNSFSSKCVCGCVQCTLHTNGRHNLKNKPKTFIYFCCCLKKLWSWISQSALERCASEHILQYFIADRFSIFHFPFCVYKICRICKMKPYAKMENFFPRKICPFFGSQFNYDAKIFVLFLFSPIFDLFLVTFLFVYSFTFTMNAHNRRRTLDNWLFQSDFQTKLFSTQFIQHS